MQISYQVLLIPNSHASDMGRQTIHVMACLNDSRTACEIGGAHGSLVMSSFSKSSKKALNILTNGETSVLFTYVANDVILSR